GFVVGMSIRRVFSLAKAGIDYLDYADASGQAGTDANGTIAADAMPDRVRRAGKQYAAAAELLRGELEREPTDREAYDRMEELAADAGRKVELPEFDTWSRYLRDYRKGNAEGKNS